jgi:hypothetical protein
VSPSNEWRVAPVALSISSLGRNILAGLAGITGFDFREKLTKW